MRRAVEELYSRSWPSGPLERLGTAFADFERLFNGQYPGYLGCDTVYHDVQHSLDDTLAMARLLVGYERSHAPEQQFGAERALLGLVVALFHDSGYIRQSDDHQHRNGAEFTLTHVGRSAQFLARYLPTIGLAEWVPVATQIVHFTGYELRFDQIRLDDPRDRKVGHLLGTADMMAQMADRCYLEKVRDRLYPEFVLGGVAVSRNGDGLKVNYGSGLDVLRQTPEFVAETMRTRLDGEFGGAYRYFEIAVRRPQPLHGSHRAQPRVPQAGARDPALVHAAPRAAVLHVGEEPAAEHACAGHRPPQGHARDVLTSAGRRTPPDAAPAGTPPGPRRARAPRRAPIPRPRRRRAPACARPARGCGCRSPRRPAPATPRARGPCRPSTSSGTATLLPVVPVIVTA